MDVISKKRFRKLIKIEDLSYKIKESIILRSLNLEIPQNKLTTIIGPNGAGKSTLLNIIARLLPLQEGEVYFDKVNLRQSNDAQLAKVMAILPQESHIISRITVKDLLIFGRYPYHQGSPKEEDFKIIQEKLEEFDLSIYQNRYLNELSGGQKQRALIGMVFAQSTPYILLDEPLNNLDIFHENNLLRLVHKNVRLKNKTIVVVLHDINHAIAFSDNIIALKDGKLVFHGPPNKVITSRNIFKLFGLRTDVIEHKGRKLVVTKRI